MQAPETAILLMEHEGKCGGKRITGCTWAHPITAEQLICERKVQAFCKRPYPNHPKGCPKYDNSDDCPPRVPLATVILDKRKPMYLIVTEFPLGEWEAEMRRMHPAWSPRQCRNLYYWQPMARKWHGQGIDVAFDRFGLETWASDNHGLYLIRMLARLGVKCPFPPREGWSKPDALTRRIVVAGHERERFR